MIVVYCLTPVFFFMKTHDALYEDMKTIYAARARWQLLAPIRIWDLVEKRGEQRGELSEHLKERFHTRRGPHMD